MTAPDKIYLQWADDDDDDYREITWCVDQIDDTDVEYCRITAEELAALHGLEESASVVIDGWKRFGFVSSADMDRLEKALQQCAK